MLNIFRARNTPTNDFSKGYPAATNLSYECKRCGDVLPSIPVDIVRCKCLNIEISSEDGRMHIESPADARLLTPAAKVADAVLRMPRLYHERNVVFYALLKESGYCNMPDEITEAVIREALAWRPEFIADWQIWSEDKRCGGWYWCERSNWGFELGYIPDGGWRFKRTRWYSDELSACAAFIKREIEHYRASYLA